MLERIHHSDIVTRELDRLPSSEKPNRYEMIARGQEDHVLERWHFIANSGPILHSKCKTRDQCVAIRDSQTATIDESKLCILCR